MPIQILPTRLANQIAAGEVVERPASVIKELVENSLDAGATFIDIEIEKGGSKLIRIRDNGCGIDKQELNLALSRHATSKVTSFDDLENITSLGFRGEALASISSVSRLKLTSKPAEQEEAWQAYAEGRDMQVTIIPAAHPDGTTIEVMDLFFNTPARRKFMRTEKTEFYHIDELVKRIALSRFDVQLSLKHNGKIVRHLRKAVSDEEKDRRIGQICGKSFIDSVMRVNCDYDEVSLSGWIALPQGCRNQNDVQYSYVNGRMMRDKLINHAIRQAYGQQLTDNQYPTFVLFLTVNPRQVDVNVHPAKHEVRFHQARLIHDFIVQALEQAIMPENLQMYDTGQAQGSYGQEHGHLVQTKAGENQVNETPAAYTVPEPQQNPNAQTASAQNRQQSMSTDYQQGNSPVTTAAQSFAHQGSYQGKQPTVKQLDSYHQALSSFSTPLTSSTEPQATASGEPQPGVMANPIMAMNERERSNSACLSVLNGHFALYQMGDGLFLLDLNKVNGKVAASQYSQGLVGQPLLLPIKMPMEKADLLWLEQYTQRLQSLGIDFECLAKAVVIRKVPAVIRNRNISDSLSQLFAWLKAHKDSEDIPLTTCLDWLFGVFGEQNDYDLMAATKLIASVVQSMDEQQLVSTTGVEIAISGYIDKLLNDKGALMAEKGE